MFFFINKNGGQKEARHCFYKCRIFNWPNSFL